MVDCIGNWADNQFNEKRVGKQLSKYSCSDHPLILSPSWEKPNWKFNKARSSAIPAQPPTSDQAARISHQASRSEWGLFQLQYSCWWLRERKQWGWWIFSWGGKWNSVVTWWFQLGIKVFMYFWQTETQNAVPHWYWCAAAPCRLISSQVWFVGSHLATTPA